MFEIYLAVMQERGSVAPLLPIEVSGWVLSGRITELFGPEFIVG